MQPFTKISRRASENQDCWNLSCTTCGSMELMKRYSRLGHISHTYRFDRSAHNNSINSQNKMLRNLGEINLVELIKYSKFPDWLGHIGLLLNACQEAENELKIVSESFLSQILEICPNNSYAFEIAQEMKSSGEVLTPEKLGRFEGDLHDIANSYKDIN